MSSRFASISFGAALCLTLSSVAFSRAVDDVPAPKTFDLTAKDTLTVVPMNHKDTLRFTLRNGEVRPFVLRDTAAHLLERV